MTVVAAIVDRVIVCAGPVACTKPSARRRPHRNLHHVPPPHHLRQGQPWRQAASRAPVWASGLLRLIVLCPNSTRLHITRIFPRFDWVCRKGASAPSESRPRTHDACEQCEHESCEREREHDDQQLVDNDRKECESQCVCGHRGRRTRSFLACSSTREPLGAGAFAPLHQALFKHVACVQVRLTGARGGQRCRYELEVGRPLQQCKTVFLTTLLSTRSDPQRRVTINPNCTYIEACRRSILWILRGRAKVVALYDFLLSGRGHGEQA